MDSYNRGFTSQQSLVIGCLVGFSGTLALMAFTGFAETMQYLSTATATTSPVTSKASSLASRSHPSQVFPIAIAPSAGAAALERSEATTSAQQVSFRKLVWLLAIPAIAVASLLRQKDRIRAIVAGAGAAALLSAAPSALAVDIKMGSDSGGLVFVPDTVTIKAGETVTWINNAGYPHNVEFDDEDVPEGVDAGALSHEDLLNAKGQAVSTTFTVPGTYVFHCEPHEGAGMVGKVIVQ